MPMRCDGRWAHRYLGTDYYTDIYVAINVCSSVGFIFLIEIETTHNLIPSPKV